MIHSDANTKILEKLPYDWRNFLSGGFGFLSGAAVGLILLGFLIWSRLAGWLVGLIPEGQPFLKALAVIFVAGLFLGIAGVVTGIGGGWSLAKILGLPRKTAILVDGGLAFGVSQGLLFLVFLVMIGLIGVYNNFNVNQIERFGILFGLFGLIFGLLAGGILAFMSVRLRYTWQIVLGAVPGFSLAGFIAGAAVQIFSPPEGFSDQRAAIALVGAFLGFYFLGGGTLGWTYGRVAKRLNQKEQAPQMALPPRWQKITTALVGMVIFLGFLSLLGDIARFLVVDPADQPSQLVSESLGVRYSEPQALSVSQAGFSTQNFEQPAMTIDDQGAMHLVWVDHSGNTPSILYSRCQDEECSQALVVSKSEGLSCLEKQDGKPGSPTIAIDETGLVMVAWQVGETDLVYSTWDSAGSPPKNPGGCVPVVQDGLVADLALASNGPGAYTLVYAVDGEGSKLWGAQMRGGEWGGTPLSFGTGSDPSLAADPQGGLHLAFCSQDGEIQYRSPEASVETVGGNCTQPPALAIGAEGEVHIAWYATQLVDVNGQTRPASVLVESVRAGGYWRSGVVAALTSQPATPLLARDGDGTLYLAWRESPDQGAVLKTTRQPLYQCDPGELSAVEQAGLAAIQAGNFRPQGEDVPFCDNRFNAILYTPNPELDFSEMLPTDNGAFDRVAALATQARYEVLFTTMQYEPSTIIPSPGITLAEAVVQLYEQVKEHPERYPRGMDVRILLGNYPELSTFQWGDQIWAVMEDLRKAGLEKLVDEEIGWRVEIANYAGTYPHAHTKFMVVDGAILVGAGFNYGYLHLPKDHPSGKGYDLFDLALDVSGPIAQEAIMAFDAMWQGADEIACDTLAGEDWRDSCQERKASVSHSAEVLHKYIPPEGQDNAFSLYRSYNYLEADAFVKSTLESATQSIDMIQVNFSLQVQCMAELVFPGICDIENALPYMTAMLEAIERDQVKVRVIMENSNSNGLENRVAGGVFLSELEKRGLEEYVELRFYNGKLHAKSILIDEELLLIGSMNMHYSSWGERALAEYMVTTDNPEAIGEYQQMFEAKWDEAIPFEEAKFNTTP